MAEEANLIEIDHIADFNVTISSIKHCSTQTVGLDTEFFSYLPAPKNAVKEDPDAEIIQDNRMDAQCSMSMSVQGPSLVGKISSCDDLGDEFKVKTSTPPISLDFTISSVAGFSNQILQQSGQFKRLWHPNNQVSNNLALLREQARFDPVHVPHYSQQPPVLPSSIQEMYPRLHKVFLKPVFSYACLIAMALKQSLDNKLPVNEIYNFMQREFPYFRSAPEGWKNSIRHNLSLNKAFYKVDRGVRADGFAPFSVTGKGCYWLLDPSKEETMNKEILKWKKKHPEAVQASMSNPAHYWHPPNAGLRPPPPHVRKLQSPHPLPRYNPYTRDKSAFFYTHRPEHQEKEYCGTSVAVVTRESDTMATSDVPVESMGVWVDTAGAETDLFGMVGSGG